MSHHETLVKLREKLIASGYGAAEVEALTAAIELLAVDDEPDEDAEPDDSLLVRLREARIVRAHVEYSGANDEGWITEVTLYGRNSADEEYVVQQEVGQLWQPSEPLVGEVFVFADTVIERLHGGYENNEGGQGTVELDVATNRARLEHGDCVEVYEYTTHLFDLDGALLSTEPVEQFGWAWIEGEDDEAGNEWAQIGPLDEDGSQSEEMAVIMCRDAARVRAEHPEWITRIENDAVRIVAALNRSAARGEL
jgi:hypothetical protein